MKIYISKKNLATALCVVFILASFFSATFIITHEDHDCTGEHCVVCCQLKNAKNTLMQLGLGRIVNSFFMPVLGALGLCVAISCFDVKAPSLVSLKVRMDH